jgi:hypothetical protein
MMKVAHQIACLPQYRAVWSRLLPAVILLLVALTGTVQAQEPQIVTAIEVDVCGDAPWPITLKLWNVGAAGGPEYATATWGGQNCINDQLSGYTELTGTFSGGPNGVASFNECDDPNNPDTCFSFSFQFVKGQQVYNSDGYPTAYVIQNPEAFATLPMQTSPTPAATPTTGPDCAATIRYDPALQPGDILSPWASYSAVPGGEPVVPIGETFFLNGHNCQERSEMSANHRNKMRCFMYFYHRS